MIVKEIRDEDFTSYKKPAMVIGFPSCSWKCEKECGERCCQNSALAQAPNINISIDSLIERYMNNPITKAIVCGGLEPMDSWEDLQCFILNFRQHSNDDIVIYTGYNEEEVKERIIWLRQYKNIVIKFGRFLIKSQSKFDPILGVTLASSNQFGVKIS